MSVRRRLNTKSPGRFAERPPAAPVEGAQPGSPGAEGASLALVQEEPEAAPAAALVAVEGGSGSIAHVVVTGSAPTVRQRARAWAELCRRDQHGAALEALNATLELAGLPGSLRADELEEDPRIFLARLPDIAREMRLDLSVYPLLPSVRHGKRSAGNFERFWSLGVGDQNAVAFLESGLLAILARWFLVMPQAAVRSLRHASTIAALAMAGGLGHHHQSLRRLHDTSQRQLEASGPGHNQRQVAQMKRDEAAAKANAEEVHNVRTQLLETIVPARSRDVSDVIRLYTLCETDRLMKQDPEMFMQNKWTARVFLMIHDPVVEVRLKAVNTIHQWYANTWKRSEAMKEHLSNFAQRCLSHLVERIGDIDGRVATSALRCLRLPSLAERLNDEEFDMIANLCVGSQDLAVREEAALFINAHVFTDPGICVPPSLAARRPPRDGEEAGDGAEAGEGGREARGADVVKELHSSDTSLCTLVEYLGNYMADQLRNADRVVSAFWGRAPALTHWATMVNLCLVGESQRGGGMEPVSNQQRLALLYLMEAGVRRADEDFQSVRPSERQAAAAKLNDACVHILPEMPRLLDICRPEEQQSLLFSHVCKILIEYAVVSCSQVLVNATAMCASLTRAIEARAPLDTTKYCIDSLLALARCFDEAKSSFLDLAKSVHHSCKQLLNPDSLREQAEDIRAAMNLFVVASNRGMDLTFGNIDVFNGMMSLLHQRAQWMVGRHGGADVVGNGQAASGAADMGGGPAQDLQEPPRPADMPDARLTLQLLEAAATTLMWHARMTVWGEEAKAPDQSQSDQNGVEAQVSQLMQGCAENAAVRGQLAPAVARFREICAELISADSSPFVRFHAYNIYMCLLQLALGVSEKVSLEVQANGEAARPVSWAGTYEVRFPEAHMKVIWQYLNNFYACLSEAGAEHLTFNMEGHRVMASSVYPAPSQGTMTSVRFLTLQCLQSAGNAEGNNLDRDGELLLAVMASRSVLESDLEDVYAGPLGLLLLTQCERSRPKPLREVALELFRRLRVLARSSEDFAVQFYRMQQEAVSGLFDCATIEAASALSIAFMRHSGPRILPSLEKPLFTVLKDAVLSCVSEDRRRLPLLEVFGAWFRLGAREEARCREITSELLQRCRAAGIDGEVDPHVAKFLQRVVQPVPLPDDTGQDHPLADASADDTRADDARADDTRVPSRGIEETPREEVHVARRLTGKRSLEECEGTPPRAGGQASASASTGTSAHKSARTDDVPSGVFQ